MPEGINAGRIHLDDLAQKLNISNQDLVTMKVEALISILAENESPENMTKDLEQRINKVVFDRISEQFKNILDMIEDHVEK